MEIPTPGILPGELHGQRSLAGYNPWEHKELDTAEQLSLHLYICVCVYTSFNIYNIVDPSMM